MKTLRKELWFNVPGRRGFVNITREIEQCVTESGVREGLVLVNAMHITASVFINDDEPGPSPGLRGIPRAPGAARAGPPIPPQRHRRGQRGRPHQAPAHGS